MQAVEDLAVSPYNEPCSTKAGRLLAELNGLSKWHAEHCVEYRRILDVVYEGRREAISLTDIPFLPVGLFKAADAKAPADAPVVPAPPKQP